MNSKIINLTPNRQDRSHSFYSLADLYFSFEFRSDDSLAGLYLGRRLVFKACIKIEKD